MTRKFRLALAATALVVSGAAHASYINLGNVTAPQTVAFGNAWVTPPMTFADEFAFTLTNNAASAYGVILEGDWWLGQTNVQLLALASSSFLAFDTTPGKFEFSNLTSGAYSLFVSGVAVGITGYAGKMTFVAQPTRVPEPSTLALLGLGLICLGFLRRRTRT